MKVKIMFLILNQIAKWIWIPIFLIGIYVSCKIVLHVKPKLATGLLLAVWVSEAWVWSIVLSQNQKDVIWWMIGFTLGILDVAKTDIEKYWLGKEPGFINRKIRAMVRKVCLIGKQENEKKKK